MVKTLFISDKNIKILFIFLINLHAFQIYLTREFNRLRPLKQSCRKKRDTVHTCRPIDRITCIHTLHVQSHPEDQGDFGQGSTNHISEYTFRLELSMYGICCSYIVLANPNMKLRIQFIIMKIIMKIVKICPKSPRFTVLLFKVLNYLSSVGLWEGNNTVSIRKG